jgi:hypothetical protein
LLAASWAEKHSRQQEHIGDDCIKRLLLSLLLLLLLLLLLYACSVHPCCPPRSPTAPVACNTD